VEADDVGVATANVGDEQDVVTPGELLEEIGDRKAVARRVGHVVDLGVRRPMQRGGVAPEHHVAVAAARRHARPLVAHEDHAPAVGVEAVDLGAQALPLGLGHLEVVGLVAHHVEQRDVAPEGEVLLDGAGAHRRPGLAVQIAPEGLGLARQDRADQIGRRDLVAPRRRDARFGARGGEGEAREPGRGQLAAPPRDARGKASHGRALRAEPDLAREPLAGIAPGVLGLDEGVERLTGSDCRGGHDDEPVAVAADHVDHRRGVEHRVQLGAEGIHEEVKDVRSFAPWSAVKSYASADGVLMLELGGELVSLSLQIGHCVPDLASDLR